MLELELSKVTGLTVKKNIGPTLKRFFVRARLDCVARRATLVLMKTVPLSIRLDKQLRSLLAEGARRTSFNQRELLRRTLRLHLREVIEREAVKPKARITNIAPWPRGALARAYKRTADKGWERVEAAATAAQSRPSWDN